MGEHGAHGNAHSHTTLGHGRSNTSTTTYTAPTRHRTTSKSSKPHAIWPNPGFTISLRRLTLS